MCIVVDASNLASYDRDVALVIKLSIGRWLGWAEIGELRTIFIVRAIGILQQYRATSSTLQVYCVFELSKTADSHSSIVFRVYRYLLPLLSWNLF